jgi:hypothetical protein
MWFALRLSFRFEELNSIFIAWVIDFPSSFIDWVVRKIEHPWINYQLNEFECNNLTNYIIKSFIHNNISILDHLRVSQQSHRFFHSLSLSKSHFTSFLFFRTKKPWIRPKYKCHIKSSNSWKKDSTEFLNLWCTNSNFQ